MIDEKMIQYISELAKVELSGEQKISLTKDLEEILEYMEILKEADLEGIEMMSHPFSETNAYREDTTTPSMSNEALLSNAPMKKDGYYVAPKTMD